MEHIKLFEEFLNEDYKITKKLSNLEGKDIMKFRFRGNGNRLVQEFILISLKEFKKLGPEDKVPIIGSLTDRHDDVNEISKKKILDWGIESAQLYSVRRSTMYGLTAEEYQMIPIEEIK